MVQKAYFSMQNGTKHFYLAYFTKLDKLRFLIGYLSIQKVIKHYYLSYFEKKKKEKEKDYKNYGPTPLEKCKFCDFSNRCFYDLKSLFLYVERQQTVLFGIFSLKRKSEKNYSFEKKNHGLTPLRECKFCDLFKSMFYSLEAIFIYLKRH